MNLQQAVQPRSSANGFGSPRVERETGSKLKSKSHSGKASRSTSSGVSTGKKVGAHGSLSRERLVYLTTCLIGHNVEVQLLDGSVYSGIFHATNAEKDFGIILKMARLTKAGSSQGQRNTSDVVSKPPSKTLIIQAKDLVQIMAKGVPITKDGLINELYHEKEQEIMLDSVISQSHHTEMERQLERWVPDKDVPECPEWGNIFDGSRNRSWDQFETNEALFGVKSTFNEDLYTTKLERGPHMIALEKEASRIAKEIEGEDTHDLHLAEERGIQLEETFDIDEETRFSSVIREVDDSGCNDNEDILMNSRDVETSGGISSSVTGKSFASLANEKSDERVRFSSSASSMDEQQSTQSSTVRELNRHGSSYQDGWLSSGHRSESDSVLDGENRIQENQFSEHCAGSNYTKDSMQEQALAEEAQTSRSEDLQSSSIPKKESFDKVGLSPNATAYAPPHVSTKGQEKTSSSAEVLEGVLSVKTGVTQFVQSRTRPGSSASSTSDCGGAASGSSGPGLSPSSSVGSSSEKLTLNPHAKEFKFNPNAKSFVPSQKPLRPASPVSDGSFYYPTSVSAVPHIHNMPVGIGIGPSFATHQPVIFNPQGLPMPSPQPYFPPNGPQMIVGHPRHVMYMPTFPPK